jgi:L-malate glycosyltransferase
MKSVTIVQRVLPHYRIPFFQRLHRRLLADGLQLRLIYGQEYPGTVPKTVRLDEPWAIEMSNSYFMLHGVEFVWQPCLKYLGRSDLIIIEQASRLLVNYLILSRLITNGAKIAYWGHGKNLQSPNGKGLGETFKRLTINRADWWFAYTGSSAKIVREGGFEEHKICLVNNSIDTVSLSQACQEVRGADILKVKRELGIFSDNICIFCGGMHVEKKLDFLVESCLLIKKKVLDFQMIFIGEGPLQQLVSDACCKNPWMHYIGPKYGNEKAPYLKTAKAILMPGLVGLVVIDSFVAGVPLITTDIPSHSPEIDYLESAKNGLVSSFHVAEYASAVANFLGAPESQEELKAGCAESSKKYTISNMVDNFASGILACLAQ